MARKVKVTKHVFYCQKCETWYDDDDLIINCEKCGRPVRELDKEEKHEFYCKIARSGYTVIDEEFEKERITRR